MILAGTTWIRPKPSPMPKWRTLFMLPEPAVRGKLWGRLAAALIGLLLLAYLVRRAGPSSTFGRDRLRWMGAAAGDRPGWTVTRRADLGVASDAARCPASTFLRQDVRVAPGVGGSGTSRRVRSDLRRYVAGCKARRGIAACGQNYFRSAGSSPVHPEQHDRDHRGHNFGGFPCYLSPGRSLFTRRSSVSHLWRLCSWPSLP